MNAQTPEMHAFEPASLEISGLPAAVYTPPAQEELRGAILIAPGGLERGDLDAYRWAGERFARAGYLTVVATYSAASPYSDPGDMVPVLDWIDENAPGASGRIVAFGHSRGGLAALAIAALDARIKAVVAIAAPADLASYVKALAVFFPAANDVVIKFMGGTPDEIPGQYESVSAVRLASLIYKPVLLVHGTADMRMPITHSLQLHAAFQAAGTDVRLETVPGMGHYFELGTLGYQFDRVVDLTTGWLKEKL